MTKYHINPETGRPNQCQAKIQCRFGSESEHYDSKEAAREGYEKFMKEDTVSKSLKKTPKVTSNETATKAEVNKSLEVTPERLPVIPGRPPVRTDSELNNEKSELEHETGYGVKELLKMRGIGALEIQEGEDSGSFNVVAKVPGYSEAYITTDLARRELGFKKRGISGADQTPYRLAEIARDEAYDAMTGKIMTAEESKVARERLAKAEEAFRPLKEEKSRLDQEAYQAAFEEMLRRGRQ